MRVKQEIEKDPTQSFEKDMVNGAKDANVSDESIIKFLEGTFSNIDCALRIGKGHGDVVSLLGCESIGLVYFCSLPSYSSSSSDWTMNGSRKDIYLNVLFDESIHSPHYLTHTWL